MFNIIKREIEWCGKTLSIETGKIAKQADGAVIASYGETTVLCTVVAAKKMDESIDFFPLTVHYKEMFFAAGKIPGGFFKREGRPSEKEVLTSRLIDRPIRPLFPEGFYHEVQVICTVLSYDGVNDPDMVAMVGTSAALSISGIPFKGPIAAIRVCMKDGEFIYNPPITEYINMDLDLVVAGTKDSVLMVESEAKQLSEQQMLEAVVNGHTQMQPVIEMIEEFAKVATKPHWKFEPIELDKKLFLEVEKRVKKDLEKAYTYSDKQERYSKIDELKDQLAEKYTGVEGVDPLLVIKMFKKVQEEVVRGNIIDKGVRIDGRDNKTVRAIQSEVQIFPRTHGSALFTRGETQAIVVTTLGSAGDEQMVDTIAGDGREHFMLHYNFPPYSVGEASALRAPGRREIGHGKLAWRAVNPVLPSKIDFPYTIRTVSEITESNGSSSMATVCGASMSLMDAGVPISEPVAGIAMGLVMEGKKFVVLSDIMGDEDHLGDMDFKVAGTSKGITALQMDIKIQGITPEVMKIALDQAKEGRMHILEKMSDAIQTSRSELSRYAPTITKVQLPKDKIGEVIGPGGKVIKDICEKTGATVDIDDNGVAFVSGPNGEATEKAVLMIKNIINDPEVGTIYTGKIVRIMDFGALVNFMGNRDGLVHISEIMDAKVDQVKDHLNEGDIVKVKLLSIDDRGKYKLSMRLVDQESGEELQDNRKVNNGNSEHHKPRGDRERDHNRERRDNHNRENREGKDRPAHHKHAGKRSHDRGDRNHKPRHHNNGNNFNNEQFNREEQPQKKESALRKLFRF